MDDPANTAPRVDGARLWSRLMDMAQIGATPGGGCNRQALTDGDQAGRTLLSQWAHAAGCQVRVDAVGNLFLQRRGSDASAPVVMTGSHLDTQPTGGKFDGVYGVLAGLEVIEALNDYAITTVHPIEVAVWCNEEGCRFPVAMMGSAVWSGRLPLEAAYALSDREGRTVHGELERLGLISDAARGAAPEAAPDAATEARPGAATEVAPGAREFEAPRARVKAAIELHIEQGPVLEQRGKTIGVVTGVQHMSRHEIVVEGQEAHAGPTPMSMRRDPIRVLADLLPALYSATERHGADARITFGCIETLPGSPNTIPGRLRFTVDLRHPEAAHYQSLRAEADRLVHEALRRYSLNGHIRCVWEAPGVVFDASCVAAVRAATAHLGLEALDIVSGAGHDSCNTAAVVPTSMIFVPCAGGLSHNEAESAGRSDIEAGANVLLHTLLLLDAAG